MKKRKNLLVVVLSVCILMSIVGMSLASILATDPSEQTQSASSQESTESPSDLDGLIEEINKRQINSKTYLDPVNKLHKSIIDMKPIHYKDNKGKWQDIALELKESNDPQFLKEYHQGDISIKLSDKSRPQDMVSIKNKDKEITFAPIDDSSVDVTLPRNVNKDLQTPNGAFGTRAANFENVYQDIDFRYELKQDAVKEIISINKPTTKNVFKFLIKANGLDAKLNSDNSVSFTDSQTNSLFFDIQKSFATDSSNKPEVYKDLTTSIEKQGSHYILTLTLDPSWLSDPERVYPIIIDPTTKYYIQDFTTQADGPSYGLMTGKAAKVYEYSPSTNYATDNLSVGENASSYDWRMYVQVNPTSSAYALLSDKRILTASQELYMYGQSDTSSRVLYMYKLSETWGESAITWNNKPNFNSTSVANETTGSNFDWKKWDITSIFDNWQSNPTSNHGLLIKIDNDNYNQYKQFYGDEYEVSGNKSAKRPRLVVSYTSPPTASISSPTGDQWTTDSTPTFTWNYTDPDTDVQNKYRVQASQSSNFSTLAFDTGNVTSSTHSYTPTTPLADGTYYWRVTVYDSYDWSGWTSSASNNGKFKVDSTAPTGSVKVNSDESYTSRQDVIMSSSASDNFSGISQIRFSDTTSFATSSWSTYATTKSYNLPTGDGSKTVYAQFKDVVGNVSSTVNDSISLETGKQTGEKSFWSYKDVAGLKVNLQTGNLIYGGTDVSIPGRGPNLHLSRTYNSLSDSTDSTNGLKWSISPSMRIIETSGYTKLIEGDGSEYVFIPNADNTYKSPPGDFRKLVKNGSGNFTLTTKDQTKFNIVSNRLSTIVDSNSNTMTISYDASDRIQNLTDASGRGLTLAYDANGRLKNTIDPANRVTTCSYDGSGRLTSVINPNNETVSYSYNAQNQLTDVTNPMGATIHITYTNNKVTQISVPTQPVANTNFSYNANKQVNVTDPNSNVYTYSLNDTGQTISVIEPMGASPDPDTDDPNTPNIDESISEPDFPDDEEVEDAAIDDYTDYWDTLTDAVEKSINQYTPPTGGQTITNNYDSNFNLIKEIRKDGSSTSYSYDANGNPCTIINRLSMTTALYYDSKNNLLKTVYPGQVINSNAYDLNNNLISEIDAEGNKITYEYDSNGNKTGDVSPKGNIPSANPEEYKTIYTYDNKGNNVVNIKGPSITNLDGSTSQKISTSSYDSIGNKLSDIDAMGNVVYYGYDKLGRLLYSRKPTNVNGSQAVTYVKIQNTYDANGNTIKEETIDESTGTIKARTEHIYNAIGQLTSQKSWNDVNDSSSIAVTSYTYDANGNKLTEIDPLTSVTTYQYDSLNRCTKTIMDDGTFIAHKYDALGNITKEGTDSGTVMLLESNAGEEVAYSNELGETDKSIYDIDGDEVKTADDDNDTTVSNHNTDGDITALTDPNGMQIAYEYDENANETKVTFNNQNPNIASQTSTSYNKADDVSIKADQLSNEINLSYNNMSVENRIDKPNNANMLIDYTAGSNIERIQATGSLTQSANVNYSYDAIGNQTSTSVVDAITNHVIASTSAEYNSRSNPTNLTDQLGVEMSFTYDKIGNVVSISNSLSPDITNYEYDNMSMLMNMNYKNNSINFLYNSAGLVTDINLPNGVSCTSAYDIANKVTSYSNKLQNTVISSGSYTYDISENITAAIDQSGTTTYKYDDINRLTNVVNTDNSRVTYSYDNLGNRLFKKDATGTISYNYNSANELTLITKPNGQTVSYSYDDNGNLLTEYTSASGTTSYSYDNFDNLVKVVKPNGDIIELVYDGNKNRYEKRVNGISTFFQYDGLGNVLMETDNNRNIKVKYIRDNEGKALAMEQNNQMYYFLYDGHGDVTSITDSGGNSVATYSYDEFGNLRSSTGSIYNPLRYTAAHNSYYDQELNLYKIGIRYYNPEIGRWITRDPVDFPNKYIYCSNNPINRIDPTGEGDGKIVFRIAGDDEWKRIFRKDGQNWKTAIKNRIRRGMRYYKRKWNIRHAFKDAASWGSTNNWAYKNPQLQFIEFSTYIKNTANTEIRIGFMGQSGGKRLYGNAKLDALAMLVYWKGSKRTEAHAFQHELGHLYGLEDELNLKPGKCIMGPFSLKSFNKMCKKDRKLMRERKDWY